MFKTQVCRKCGAVFVPNHTTGKSEPVCQFCMKNNFPAHRDWEHFKEDVRGLREDENNKAVGVGL